MKVTIIKTDGTESVHDVNGIRQIMELIGALALDSVNLRDGRVMFVDDNGYETVVRDNPHSPGFTELVPVKARKPVNAKATALYHAVCIPGTTHRIVGDVAIVLDADFE